MKVLLVYDVDFCNLPLSSPTIENCKKCAFYLEQNIPGDRCAKEDTRICNIGRNGYFVKNYLREDVDALEYLERQRGE
jgi:hypothetical protein